MIESLSLEETAEKKRHAPDTTDITSSSPEEYVQSKAIQLKEYFEEGGLSSKDAKAQVNRLLSRRGVNFQLADKTEKLA